MGIISSGSYVLLCLQVAVIAGDTILYTNSPRHLITSENYTSYKLAVPGANPITIIEATQGPPPNADADPSARSPGLINEMRKQNWIRDEEFLFRRKQDSEDKEHERTRTTVYSPDLLKKFLTDYADKVKKPSDSAAASTEKKEKLQEILLFDDDEEDNFPLNSQPEEKYGHQQWGQSNNKKHKYDTDQRYDRPNSGWVTMDVIPWSSSKVSKWQGHVQKLPSRPQTDYSRPDYVSVEDFDDDRYNSHYRPSRPSYGDYDEVDRFSSSSSAGGYNKFNKYHDKKPYYDYQTSASNQNNNYHQQHHHTTSPGENTPNKDIYRPWRGDIITDNRAPDFPDHHHSSAYPNKKRRPASPSSPYDNHSGESHSYNYNSHHPHTRPTDSPDSGNGEWILVSTTKGYHFPRHGQRAIAMKPPSFAGHKSVQLSVTNPKGSTFSFDSDQHSQQHLLYGGDQSGEQSMHSTTGTAAPPVKKTTTTVQKKKVVKKVFPVKSPGVDGSAVLAAVGAGMVPATVAMLMPMLAGRRRRKRDLFATRNVTHFPDLDYEETLPRIILHQHVR